ncbi:anti-sigma factor [Egbenema bharatensis]|uniref:anti-sigma factor n=1 Tax=Egbenema bharatensis TaxID=3463334 RepID=UPI003A8684ED
MSTPSEQLELLIAGYVLGDLSPEEAAELAQLLADDPAIAAEVAQMQTALELTYTPPEVQPPAHLRTAILEQAHLTPDAISGTTPQPDRLPPASPVRLADRRSRFPWRRAVDVAAAALILALGLSNYRLQQALQATQPDSPQYTILTYSLQPTQANSEASARVAVNPNTLEANLIVENLPPLPPGQVYVVWTVLEPNAPFTTDDKDAILTEVFQVDEQGNFSRIIAVPEVYRFDGVVTNVAVTIEDASAPQLHVGAPIVIAEPL